MSSIEPFLRELRYGWEVVVKASDDLPFVPPNSDVDIYTLAPQPLLESLINVARKEGYGLLRTQTLSTTHLQFDILNQDVLLFRFDIYSDFPDFKRFAIRPELFPLIVGSASFKAGEKQLSFPRPSHQFESLLRYVEYCEFYWIGPEKTHHLDWLLSKLSEAETANLFELAHHFVTPRFDKLAPSSQNNNYLLRIVRFLASSHTIRRLTPRPVINAARRLARRWG